MSDVLIRLPDAVSDARGTFHGRAMARQRGDGSWEGWLEFIRTDGDATISRTTPIETHQRDRVALERWASGLTRVYAEGALARALRHAEPPAAELVSALHEIVEVLDRRIPQVERAGEAQLAADARRLRAASLQRLGP